MFVYLFCEVWPATLWPHPPQKSQRVEINMFKNVGFISICFVDPTKFYNFIILFCFLHLFLFLILLSSCFFSFALLLFVLLLLLSFLLSFSFVLIYEWYTHVLASTAFFGRSCWPLRPSLVTLVGLYGLLWSLLSTRANKEGRRGQNVHIAQEKRTEGKERRTEEEGRRTEDEETTDKLKKRNN